MRSSQFPGAELSSSLLTTFAKRKPACAALPSGHLCFEVSAMIPDSGESSPPVSQAENLQPIGAFKLRGAYNKIASLSPEERKRGVITYSSGNHAQGVAYAARALATKAVIVMPGNAPAIKLDATAALGAEIVQGWPGQPGAAIQGGGTCGAARIRHRASLQRRKDHRRPRHDGTGDSGAGARSRNRAGAGRRRRDDQRGGGGHQAEQAVGEGDWRGTGVGGRRAGQLSRAARL